MPHHSLPHWVEQALTALGLLFAAYVGRLTFHAKEVRAGRRRFWSWDLLLDIPTAAGMALLGYGLTDWYGLSGPVSAALTGVLGYLGPRGLEVLTAWWIRRRQPETK